MHRALARTSPRVYESHVGESLSGLDLTQIGNELRDERLAHCTEEIDTDLVAAVREAWQAEGADPLRPSGAQKEEAAFDRFARQHPTLSHEVAERYRRAMSEMPEDERPSGYEVLPPYWLLRAWITQHVEELLAPPPP